MYMPGSNLVLREAFGQTSHGDVKLDTASERLPGSALTYLMHNDCGHSRQTVTVRFAAVAALVVAFLGMLFAVATVTDTTDDANLAGHPIPIAAPTAVLEQGDQDQSIFLAEGFDEIRVSGDAQERDRVDFPAASTIVEASASQSSGVR